MEPWIAFGLWPGLCHFAGSLPFGWLVGRLYGIDIRHHGSRNVGATNVGRVLGGRAFAVVFTLDVLKGLLPTLAAAEAMRATGADPDSADYHLARVLCVMGAVTGHVFSFWLNFQGGKGVATALGGVLAVWPQLTWPGLAAFAIWGVVLAAWRFVSLASLAAALAFPILLLIISGATAAFGRQWPLMVFALVLALLIAIAHRANVRRLLDGTEPQIGRQSSTATTGS